MADFTPSKKTAQDFNNGVEYIDGDADAGILGDAVKAESINSVIEGLLYTQGIAANQPDVSEANQVGIANASIVTASDGTARLKLSNLKGEQGVGISTIVSDGTDVNGGNIYKITLDDGRTYNFVAPKGEKGDTGNGIALTAVTYATSTSGTTAPTSGWQSTIPTVAQGGYLWTRTVTTYTNGNTSTSYSSARQGKDGTVTSVNEKTGVVSLSESDAPPAVGRHHIQFSGEPTPAAIWAGTSWEIDTTMQGRTIIGSGGSYILGDTGGEEKHTQTVAEMAPHFHYPDNGYSNIDNRASGSNWVLVAGRDDIRIWKGDITTSTTGSGEAFNIMQPYAVVNFWKRTA